MAAPSRPAEPLLVVLGSTGTGKSELAVELASRFRGEIINADAMQLYQGMPVITNKMTETEQRGIPHHLLGHITLGEMPWDVDKYKRNATRVIQEIRGRGNLPILVGGTQYYVDPLLFKDVTLDDIQVDQSQSFPILEEPTEVLLEELRKVDPVMADRWHPNDRRKIQRSLEIFLQTGTPASTFYAEQKKRKDVAASKPEGTEWNNLLFWVYSEREVLKERLDARIDKMLDAGLLKEVEDLLAFKEKQASTGLVPDMTKGIWQSIGYKQFEPYVIASKEGKPTAELEPLHAQALTDMKVATRRYANYQTKWIRLKQIPLLKDQGQAAMDNLYLVDSTDVSRFQESVVEPAVRITAQFLSGEPRPAPTDVSGTAQEVLGKSADPPPKETPCQRVCEACQMTLVTEQAWKRHVNGSAHRRVLKRKKRLALVPVDVVPEGEGEGEGGGKGSDNEGHGLDMGMLEVTNKT